MSKFRNNPTSLKLKTTSKAGLLLGFAVLLLLAACQQESPDQETVLLPTIPLATSFFTAATLPPTWTPAPSRTPVPTFTPSETPIPTLTPTATTTLTASEICSQFALVSAPDEGISIAYTGLIAFSWDNSPPDSVVVLSLVRLKDGSETLTQFPPEYQRNAYFELTYLPTWGEYRWTLSLFLEPYGELCPTSGTFFREPWWNAPIINPLAPPFIFRQAG